MHKKNESETTNKGEKSKSSYGELSFKFKKNIFPSSMLNKKNYEGSTKIFGCKRHMDLNGIRGVNEENLLCS